MKILIQGNLLHKQVTLTSLRLVDIGIELKKFQHLVLDKKWRTQKQKMQWQQLKKSNKNTYHMEETI